MRFENVYLMAPFLKQLDKLTRTQPSLRAKMLRITQQFLSNFENLPDRTPLRRNPRKKIWHTDINAGNAKRLIDEQLGDEFRDSVAFLYLGHHDDANSYGERYDRDTESDIRRNRAELVRGDTSSAARRPSDGPSDIDKRATKKAHAQGTYGEYLKARQLRRLGLSDPLVDEVLGRMTSQGLGDLQIPVEVSDKIENLYLACIPEPMALPPVPGIGEPTALKVGVAELPSVLRLPLSRFLSQLSDVQARLATRENRGLYVVRGAAGSGKTIVGIRRLEFWLNQRDLFDERPILYVCYNNILQQVAEQLITATVGRDLAAARIEVTTIYRLFGRLNGTLGVDRGRRSLSLVDDSKLLPLLAQARVAAGLPSSIGRWSDEDLLKEIREVIYGRALSELEEYLEADRTGRGREYALDDRGRTAVWQIYRAFRESCDRAGLGPWEHLPARFLSFLRRNPRPAPLYAGIVIDEVQDLTPAAVQALVALQAGRTEDILVLGDAAQNVFGSGFRWKHLGLRVTGAQVNTLRQCFRSTAPIVRAAVPLIHSQGESMEDDLVLPEAIEDSEAPPVSLTVYETPYKELEEVAYAVASRAEAGVPPSAIGVLLDDETRRLALGDMLTALDCNVEDYLKRTGDRRTKSIDVSHPSVKLLTTGSAKGLEFQVLFLPGLTEERFPGSSANAEERNLAQRELYTAMMRCGWELHLSASKGEETALLSNLGPVKVKSS